MHLSFLFVGRLAVGFTCKGEVYPAAALTDTARKSEKAFEAEMKPLWHVLCLDSELPKSSVRAKTQGSEEEGSILNPYSRSWLFHCSSSAAPPDCPINCPPLSTQKVLPVLDSAETSRRCQRWHCNWCVDPGTTLASTATTTTNPKRTVQWSAPLS